MHCNVRKFWNLETLNQKWNEKKNTFNQNKVYLLSILSWKFGHLILAFTNFIQVILLEIDCAIFYTNLHELLCQFISWTNWVNYGKFMENCCISCQVIADMEKIYDDLIIINLYQSQKFYLTFWPQKTEICLLMLWDSASFEILKFDAVHQ